MILTLLLSLDRLPPTLSRVEVVTAILSKAFFITDIDAVLPPPHRLVGEHGAGLRQL